MMIASPASMSVASAPCKRSIFPSWRRTQFSPILPSSPPASPNGGTRRWPERMVHSIFSRNRIVRRTIRFLEKMECTILSGHRRVPPFGLAGGEDGKIGENWVRRQDGKMERLHGADATLIDAGEAIIIQTPTAGGYGEGRS